MTLLCRLITEMIRMITEMVLLHPHPNTLPSREREYGGAVLSHQGRGDIYKDGWFVMNVIIVD
jgi:hypothetical protein